MIGVESQHPLECPQRIALASEIDEYLSERDQGVEVIEVPADECNDARERASRPSAAAIGSHQLHHCGVVIRRDDEHRLQLTDRAVVIPGPGEQASECDTRLGLPLVYRQTRAIGGNRLS